MVFDRPAIRPKRAGLDDEPRSGRRVIDDESVERRIFDQLAKAPPPGFASIRSNDRES